MAELKNIVIPAEGAKIDFENPFVATEVNAEHKWNTGLAAAEGAAAVVADDKAFEAKKIASIRLYKNNEYVVLNPGDKLSIPVRSANEALYYLNMADTEILKITNRDDFVEVTEVEDDPATAKDNAPAEDAEEGTEDEGAGEEEDTTAEE